MSAALAAWSGPVPADQVVFVDSDPAVADTADFVAAHGPELRSVSANCVVVAGKRGGQTRLAACVVRSPTRVDVNGTVRRHLGARKASFAPHEVADGESGMEYGGITPIGLPADWPVLLDAAVVDLPWVLLGSGRRRGELILPGKALLQIAGSEVVEGLGR
ncbi:YbaK/EbsC family protein [Streptomyces sp. PT12]|uniref:YbaK/EbsC family protein n=1 Tax=Streptomyces sp. PT12 TaxID=1510197 RepID=UPI000DE32534|nr:YbaK/EbsC family protein [Streptomyces sp. PT12]RBM12157.1 hypothetical protein DEH69_20370 [Streptomyces sp. PT12]